MDGIPSLISLCMETISRTAAGVDGDGTNLNDAIILPNFHFSFITGVWAFQGMITCRMFSTFHLIFSMVC